MRNEGAITTNIWMNFSLISQEGSWFLYTGEMWNGLSPARAVGRGSRSGRAL